MPKPAITRVPNLAITPVSTNKNNGLYAPQLTTTQITTIPASTLTNGAIVYNTTTNTFQVYQNGVWTALYSTTNLAGNLIVPVVANTGALPAAPANGMIVYQTDVGAFKVYQTNANGAEWAIMYNNVSTATGAGLAAGDNPFTLPNAAAAGVETLGNQVNGFMYYDATSNSIKARVNGAWVTVTVT
jgi:hypothetical protein